MDTTKALERNRDALIAIILALLAMLRAGISGDWRITRILRKTVLRILVPAESAVRRLIVIAARGLPQPSLWQNWYPGPPGERRKGKPVTSLAFPLFEPQKRGAPKPSRPRIRSTDDVLRNPSLAVLVKELQEPPPQVDPTVDARRLWLRFAALNNALADLPAEARRLVWHQARRGLSEKLSRRPPLRSGDPPGQRKKHSHPVDDILKQCQHFAQAALADTS